MKVPQVYEPAWAAWLMPCAFTCYFAFRVPRLISLGPLGDKPCALCFKSYDLTSFAYQSFVCRKRKLLVVFVLALGDKVLGRPNMYKTARSGELQNRHQKPKC